MPWGQVKLLPMDGGSNRACRGITQGQTGFTSQVFFWGVAKQWGNDFSKPFVELQTKFVEDKDCVAPVQLVDHCCLLFWHFQDHSFCMHYSCMRTEHAACCWLKDCAKSWWVQGASTFSFLTFWKKDSEATYCGKMKGFPYTHCYSTHLVDFVQILCRPCVLAPALALSSSPLRNTARLGCNQHRGLLHRSPYVTDIMMLAGLVWWHPFLHQGWRIRLLFSCMIFFIVVVVVAAFFGRHFFETHI